MNTPSADPSVLNIHIIAHSHCDPGWLDTFEGYYMKQVRKILDGVLDELTAPQSEHRRFVWSESSFFHRWWKDLSADRKAKWKRLVEARRIEFIGGGWSQNDEANPDHVAVVNQVTTGHQFLEREFGPPGKPRFAWQIDPFGHSSMTASLFALMGFEGLVINRIHHQVKAAFKNSKHMEFMWRGADVGAGSASNIFTHVLHTHYSAPHGFDFEGGGQRVSGSNVAQRAQALVGECRKRSDAYRTNHLLVPFGDDFKFQRAAVQFSNMDQLIAEINGNPDKYKARIFYSTLSTYFDAVRDFKGAEHPVHEGDFFPYADNEDSYWTGYYTTRPHLKMASRRLETTVRSAEILNAAFALPDPFFDKLMHAREQTGLFLHHDAITGTCREAVERDYMQRMNEAERNMKQMIEAGVAEGMRHPDRDANDPLQLTHDAYTLTAHEELLHPIVVWNSLAWERQELVTVKVATRYVAVYDSDGQAVPAAQVDLDFRDETMPYAPTNKHFLLRFVGRLPPLGAATFLIQVSHTPIGDSFAAAKATVTRVLVGRDLLNGPQGGGGVRGVVGGSASSKRLMEAVDSALADMVNIETATLLPQSELSKAITIENDLVSVSLRPSGMVESITDKRSGAKVDMRQEVHEYSTRKGGAYLFRPMGAAKTVDHSTLLKSALRVVEGPVGTFVEGRYHRFRVSGHLFAGSDPELCGDYHFSTTVTASANQELGLRFTTDMRTDSSIYTHNGNHFLRRTFNPSPKPGPSNFYPMVYGARMVDATRKVRLTLINDHTMSVGSLKNGQLEIIVHRQLSQDDGRGLAQAIRDTSQAEIRLVMRVDASSEADDKLRNRHYKKYQLPDVGMSRQAYRTNNPIRILYPVGDARPSATSTAAVAPPAAGGGGSGANTPSSSGGDNAWMDFIKSLDGIPLQDGHRYAQVLQADHVQLSHLSQLTPEALKALGIPLGHAVILLENAPAESDDGDADGAAVVPATASSGPPKFDPSAHFCTSPLTFAFHHQARFSLQKRAFPEDVHLLSLSAHTHNSRVLTVRIQSIAPHPDATWSFQWSDVFSSYPSSSQSLTLAMHTDLSHNAYIVPTGFAPSEDKEDLHDLSLAPLIPDDSERQNTDEAGVFISDAALDDAATAEDDSVAATDTNDDLSASASASDSGSRRLLAMATAASSGSQTRCSSVGKSLTDASGSVTLRVDSMQLRTYRITFAPDIAAFCVQDNDIPTGWFDAEPATSPPTLPSDAESSPSPMTSPLPKNSARTPRSGSSTDDAWEENNRRDLPVAGPLPPIIMDLDTTNTAFFTSVAVVGLACALVLSYVCYRIGKRAGSASSSAPPPSRV